MKLKSILTESKETLIGIGYPKLIASMFYKLYGNKSYILAKWHKEYRGGHNYDNNKWFFQAFFSFNSLSVVDMISLYNATFLGSDAYIKECDRLELSHEPEYDGSMLEEERLNWYEYIKKEMFENNLFFKSYHIVKDYIGGKLTNIAPYKDMNFFAAAKKYDERRIFNEAPVLKSYPNGYKWINVGKRSEYIGCEMKNCGSTGVMGTDPERTMLALFGHENKPHVIVTYSPNEKKLSGIEGGASTESIKDEYTDYVLDLQNVVGAKIKTSNLKTMILKIKVLFEGKIIKLHRIKSKISSLYSEIFKLKLKDNKLYLTNGYQIISYDDLKKIKEMLDSKVIKKKNYGRFTLNSVFDYRNIGEWESAGISIPYIEKFAEEFN